jgi:hypothetical protein
MQAVPRLGRDDERHDAKRGQPQEPHGKTVSAPGHHGIRRTARLRAAPTTCPRAIALPRIGGPDLSHGVELRLLEVGAPYTRHRY